MSAAKLVPFLLATGGLAALHLIQKTMPASANAGTTIAAAYLVATLTCLLAYPLLSPGQSPAEALRSVPWNAVAMGVAIAACEIGVLLAYRAGWPVGTTGVAIGAVMTLVLFPVGVLAFGEALTLTRAAGVATTLAGLYLLAR